MDGDELLTPADLEILRLAFRGALMASLHSDQIRDLVRLGYLELLPALTVKGLEAIRGKEQP